MKKRNVIVLSALFAFAVSLAFTAAKAPSNVALFWIIKNSVEKKQSDQSWKSAKKGELIYGDDLVRTQKESFALIKFNDASTLRLGPNAEVQIYGENNPASTQVTGGDVGFTMTKRKTTPFQFTTPTSVASIRGTQGLLVVQLNGTDFLTIIEGLVRLENKYSRDTVNVGAGQTGESSSNGDISVHESTQDDLNRLAQLNNAFGQKHELKIQFRGNDGRIHELIIQTQQ
jgi:FecR protein